MRQFLLPLTLLPLPALAETSLEIDLQTNLPYLEQADVAGGSLWVEPFTSQTLSGWQLVFNGEPVPGMADAYVNIQGVIPRPEFTGEDLVFVTLAGGGNACPTLWAIVVTSAAGAKASKAFGTCSEAILNPRLTMDALLAFDMAPVAEGQPWMAYTVDGTDIWETALAAPP
jgi:hypothetical protein